MQLWRPEFELDGINSDRWYHWLPIRIYISLIVRGRLYSSCVQSSMLHGSDTWPISKENEVAFQRAKMRIIIWMCDIMLQDSFK